ncbi:MAG: acyl carrier protein [Anaerolineae bacterium]|nr:acyl carrier protein [Anaerolineae bacterium]
MKDELVTLILDTLREMGSSGQFTLDGVTAETPLFGKNGLLDSIGLVSLIVAVEQGIEDRYQKAVSLADEKAFSQKKSPFRSIDSLADYAIELINAG